VILYYSSISVVILAIALYHVSEKASPSGVDAPPGLLAAYAMAMVLPAGLLWCTPPKDRLLVGIRRLTWARALVAA